MLNFSWENNEPAIITNDSPLQPMEILDFQGGITEGNHIFFYNKIDSKNILSLNKSMLKLSKKLLADYGNDAPPIKIHINSPGGSLVDGFAAMDIINNCSIPVHTIVEGMSSSAATFLSIIGKKRYITQNSYMLIHQLRSIAWGKYEEIKDEMQNLDELMAKIKLIYSKYTKVPEKVIEEILKHDLLWDSAKCLEYGLVDEII